MYPVIANGIRTGYPRGFNKGRSSKFRVGSRVWQRPEEGRRTYRPKRCGNSNKDEDNIEFCSRFVVLKKFQSLKFLITSRIFVVYIFVLHIFIVYIFIVYIFIVYIFVLYIFQPKNKHCKRFWCVTIWN